MLLAIGLLLIERTIFHIVNSKTYYLRRRVRRVRQDTALSRATIVGLSLAK
jgi:hypothetical protein